VQVSRAEFARIKAKARKARRAEKVAENAYLKGPGTSQDAPGRLCGSRNEGYAIGTPKRGREALEARMKKQNDVKTTWAHMAPHAVTDTAKLARMIATLNAGGDLPSVLWDGNQAFEGSHRLAAWEAVGIDADLVLVSNADLERAADALDADADSVDWTDEDNLAVLREITVK